MAEVQVETHLRDELVLYRAQRQRQDEQLRAPMRRQLAEQQLRYQEMEMHHIREDSGRMGGAGGRTPQRQRRSPTS